MIVTFKLDKPYEDLYLEYTGTRNIQPANSKDVQDRMRAKMKERGYIMDKVGNKCYQIPRDTSFDCLVWCIEQSIKGICKKLNDTVIELAKPFNATCVYSYKDNTFTLDFANNPGVDLLDSIKATIEDADGILTRAKFTVSYEVQERLI